MTLTHLAYMTMIACNIHVLIALLGNTLPSKVQSLRLAYGVLQMLDGGAAQDALTAPRLSASAWGFAKLPSLDTLFGSIENGHESSFLASLTSSRTFHCPDCAHCMAELLQVSRALEGLQVACALLRRVDSPTCMHH